MQSALLSWRSILLLAVATLLSGCGPAQPRVNVGASEPAQPAEKDSAAAVPSDAKAAPAPAVAKTPADEEPAAQPLEPFDAPPLEELNKTAEWVDQPVIDFTDQFNKRILAEKPLVSVEEALKLRNTSPEINAKIISALGRPPKNDEEVNWGGHINRHLAGDVNSLVPILASSAIEGEVIGLMGIGFLGFDWDTMQTAASKDSVVSWQSSKDRKMDKIVMRNDMTWSDGKPITAYDVEFSFQTIMNPKVPALAQRSGTDKLRWVKAYDAHTVVFFHRESLATNSDNVSFSIIPKHIWEPIVKVDPEMKRSEAALAQERNPVVGGAYEMARRVRGQEIVLKRRESYYMHGGKQVRDKAFFNEVRFRIIQDQNTAMLALKSAKIDEMMLLAEQWSTQASGDDFYKNNTKAHGVEWTEFQFAWNQKTPFFADKKVRQAMTAAMNHQELLDRACYGLYTPAVGIFHPGSWMFPKNPPKPVQQDLDLAEKLLDEAGWTDSDGDGIRDKLIDGKRVPFEFTILVSQASTIGIQACTLLRESLQYVGVRCNIKLLETTVFFEKTQNKEFQAYFGGWGTGTDPDSLTNIFASGEGRNYISYSNPEVDKLFEEGRKEFDREKRADIYRKIHMLLWDDQPYTWLYVRSAFYGFNKSLRGYRFSPRGPYSYSPGFGNIWQVAQ